MTWYIMEWRFEIDGDSNGNDALYCINIVDEKEVCEAAFELKSLNLCNFPFEERRSILSGIWFKVV